MSQDVKLYKATFLATDGCMQRYSLTYSRFSLYGKTFDNSRFSGKRELNFCVRGAPLWDGICREQVGLSTQRANHSTTNSKQHSHDWTQNNACMAILLSTHSADVF